MARAFTNKKGPVSVSRYAMEGSNDDDDAIMFVQYHGALMEEEVEERRKNNFIPYTLQLRPRYPGQEMLQSDAPRREWTPGLERVLNDLQKVMKLNTIQNSCTKIYQLYLTARFGHLYLVPRETFDPCKSVTTADLKENEIDAKVCFMVGGIPHKMHFEVVLENLNFVVNPMGTYTIKVQGETKNRYFYYNSNFHQQPPEFCRPLHKWVRYTIKRQPQNGLDLGIKLENKKPSYQVLEKGAPDIQPVDDYSIRIQGQDDSEVEYVGYKETYSLRHNKENRIVVIVTRPFRQGKPGVWTREEQASEMVLQLPLPNSDPSENIDKALMDLMILCRKMDPDLLNI